MKLCTRCNEKKDWGYFSKNKRAKDGYQRICKLCKKEEDHRLYLLNPKQILARNKRYSDKIKEWWKVYRTTLKCTKCNEDRFWVIDLHHLDPNEKEYNVSSMIWENHSLKKIQGEIDKCIPLCANCHRDYHYHERIK